jgi:putative SOS response-associated peptidase YedK
VQELPTFADAFRNRRAIVPATEYYVRTEKDGRSQRYVVTRSDGKPMAWAGLWESFVWPDERVKRSYCVITVDANATIAPYHDRMPLILEAEDWPVWLGETPGDPASLLRMVDPSVIRCEPIAPKRQSR